jgi:hypothetical protein
MFVVEFFFVHIEKAATGNATVGFFKPLHF